jgi:N-acyl-L-homoserine lactone synthetase
MQSHGQELSAHIFWADQRNPKAQEVLELRKRLFVDHLNWKLRTKGQLEIDQFDNDSAVYAALKNGPELVGMFRIIRCDEPYLAETVFRDLAVTSPYPKTAACYEVSRFGVWPGRQMHRHADILYALMFQFALLRRARSLIAVTDLVHERNLAARKIRTRRFGMPVEFPAVGDSKPYTLVAGEIPISRQGSLHLQSLLSSLNGVAIHDETLVFGHQSVSA